jgi:hypothetical protein
MKRFKTRLLALCGLMVLAAAMLAPMIANASCPLIRVRCPNGSEHGCAGTQQGHQCFYDAECLTSCGNG